LTYIQKPYKLKIGDKIINDSISSFNIGNALSLNKIPTGSFLHNIELITNKGAQFARALGTYGQLLRKTPKYAIIRLCSKEIRKVSKNNFASLGIIDSVTKYEYSKSNIPNKYLIKVEKLSYKKELFNTYKMNAGKNIILGKKPHVRGTAMNPVDHPHGGKSRGKLSQTPWSRLTKGYPTRNKKK